MKKKANKNLVSAVRDSCESFIIVKGQERYCNLEKGHSGSHQNLIQWEGSDEEYKTLEQQIVELWASRGLEVLEEKFEALGDGKLKWTIIARRIELVTCPKCETTLPGGEHGVAVRQHNEEGFLLVEVGWHCNSCGHEWGFEEKE